MATEVDLADFHRGDTWKNKFTLQDSGGAPIDITNREYWITLKLDPTETDANADAQVQTTATGGDALNGIVIVTMPAATTAGLEPGSYHYDVQEKDVGGEINTLMYGRVRVLRDITISTA